MIAIDDDTTIGQAFFEACNRFAGNCLLAVPANAARAYDPAGRFLGLVEPGAAGRLQVQRLFVPGAGTNGSSPKT